MTQDSGQGKLQKHYAVQQLDISRLGLNQQGLMQHAPANPNRLLCGVAMSSSVLSFNMVKYIVVGYNEKHQIYYTTLKDP